jgi:DNA-binding transcriptional regulator YiaG
MAQLDEAAALCNEVQRLREQLAFRKAVIAGTLWISTQLIREVERVRQDAERVGLSRGWLQAAGR